MFSFIVFILGILLVTCIPITIFHIILLLFFQINFYIMVPNLYLKVGSFLVFYLLIIFITNDKKEKSGINKKNMYYLIFTFVLFILGLFLNKEFINIILKEFIAFLLVIIYYIDIYNSKFNKLTTTFKNLKASFYLFILFTASLFGFKYYLLVNSIKQPSFWYLFLTIPISGLVIYFYVKDLKPIFDEFIKESKEEGA